jgi:hypothetical protein
MKQVSEMEPVAGSLYPETPQYPYGLVVCLDEQSIKKLGLIAMPMVGEKMKLNAVVEVRSVGINDSSERGKDRRIELQITDMALSASDDKPEGTNHAKVLYEMEDM